MSITKQFDFEDSNITVVKEDNDIWFKAYDVAIALGYIDADQAIRTHVKENEKRKVQQISPRYFDGVVKNMICQINEPGLYRLIFSSKLESAEKFKTWVFSEVLPSIRKTGQYQRPEIIHNRLSIMSENSSLKGHLEIT